MARPRKTFYNPHQLTTKQTASLELALDNLEEGKGLNLGEATDKVYNAKNVKVSRVIASENLARPNFREALLDGLKKRKIIGINSLVEQQLDRGLKAIDYHYKRPDHKIRLEYIKEINKILGTYAPTKIDQRTLSLTGKLPQNPNEIDQQIQKLTKELGG